MFCLFFPQMVESVISEGVIGRARKCGIIDFNAVNLRDYTYDNHKTTDDAPFGGGPGMVMKCEPVFEAVEALSVAVASEKPHVVLMTPQGRVFNQKIAEELASCKHLIFVCGRYEGFDERIRQYLADDEISVGDYVLSGGELAAMVVSDAVARLVPGVLGDEMSPQTESFSSGLLEYPQFTRPADFRGYRVPDVLLSGNHEKINKWRRMMSLKRTLERRPELLDELSLSKEDRRILKDLIGTSDR